MDDYESRTLGTQSDGPVGKMFVFKKKTTMSDDTLSV